MPQNPCLYLWLDQVSAGPLTEGVGRHLSIERTKWRETTVLKIDITTLSGASKLVPGNLSCSYKELLAPTQCRLRCSLCHV